MTKSILLFLLPLGLAACIEIPPPVFRDCDFQDNCGSIGSDNGDTGHETKQNEDTYADTITDLGPDIKTGTDTATNSAMGSDAGPATNTETETPPPTDAGTQIDTDEEINTNTGTDAGVETDSEIEVNTNTDGGTSSDPLDCEAESSLRCVDGRIHEFDSCGNDLGFRQACMANQFCSHNGVGLAECVCSGHRTGDHCTECKGNWNVDSDCATCLPGFGNVEDNCGTVVRYVRSDAPAGGDGLGWGTAFRSIQAAIDNAHAEYWKHYNGDKGRVEVWVAEGTYYIHGSMKNNLDHTRDSIVLKPNVHVFGGFRGDEIHWLSRDLKANPTILSGRNATDPELQVQHVVVGEDASTLDGFIITEGKSDTYGGGFINQKSPLISNCTFLDNSAAQGGAFASLGGFPELRNCIFVDNAATSGPGGAVYVKSPITIDKSVFANNTADSGGALYNKGIGLKQISDTVFVGNASTGTVGQNGGAIKNDSETKLLLVNTIIAGNISKNQAGAIENVDVENVEIVNCAFVENQAVREASTLFQQGGTTSIINTIIWDGLASIVNVDDNVGSIDVSYSIVEGGFEGLTNIYEDPQFFGHPLSQGKTWSDISFASEFALTTLTDATSKWNMGELKGKFLRPSTKDKRWAYILNNDESNIYVYGDMRSFVSVDDAYEIIDLTPSSTAPTIDAGDGYVSPNFDFRGYWRMDRPNTPDRGVGPYELTYVDIGPYEWVNPADSVFVSPGIVLTLL